jgi:hypothetical protein
LLSPEEVVLEEALQELDRSLQDFLEGRYRRTQMLDLSEDPKFIEFLKEENASKRVIQRIAHELIFHYYNMKENAFKTEYKTYSKALGKSLLKIWYFLLDNEMESSDLPKFEGNLKVIDKDALDFLQEKIEACCETETIERERLVLICRGALQVWGEHTIHFSFTTELAGAVLSYLMKALEFVRTYWTGKERKE